MMLCRAGKGHLLTVARDNTFIVMRARRDDHPIDRETGVHLWHALSSDRGVQRCMSLLAQDGLEEMPDFALIQLRGTALHVIVRGLFTVLLLNHDGRYSSVDADGAATWREYADLPAAEFCIRGIPGLTLAGTDTDYLASGVTTVSLLCSLGWDDPDDPVLSTEHPATGAHQIARALSGSDDSPRPYNAAAPSSRKNGMTAVPEALKAEVKAWDRRQKAVTQVMPVVDDDLLEAAASRSGGSDDHGASHSAASPAPSPERLRSPADARTGWEQSSSAIASGAIPLPVYQALHTPNQAQRHVGGTPTLPPPPPPTAPRLGEATQPGLPAYLAQQTKAPTPAPSATSGAQPSAPQHPNPHHQVNPEHQPDSERQVTEEPQADPGSDDDHSSTILTGNLVEYRQAMETSSSLRVPSEPVSAGGAVPIPTLKLSNGVRIPLDRTVLIGRAPQASRLPVHELPRLVNVASPNNDVSRTHAQVRIDGELVLVTDLNSTNGVLLTEPGQQPRRLHPDEPTPLSSGALVDLGDGVTFELEDNR